MKLVTRNCVEWETDSGQFSFESSNGRGQLVTYSGEAIELDKEDWLLVSRAICLSYEALHNKPVNAGQPWTEPLDRELVQSWHRGDDVRQIAKAMGRTSGSIASRLVRLDIVPNRDDARRRNPVT